MVDILDEVKDEIEQEKIQNFWKENGTFIIVTVALVISIVGGRAFWTDYKFERDAERTSAMIQAMETEHLADYTIEAEGAHAAISNMLAVSDEMTDRDGQIAYLQSIADNGDFDEIYRDMAALKAIGLRAEDNASDKSALIDQLEPLTEDDRPFRASAIELKAFLLAGLNKHDEAIALLDDMLEDAENLPPQFQARMETLRAYYTSQKGA